MNDITVKTAAINNNNMPIICKSIAPNAVLEWSKPNNAAIWKPVLIFPRLLTFSGILLFNSANLCLIAITRNSLEMMINDDKIKIIESSDLASKNIVITTRSISAIGSRNAPKAVVWLKFLAT